MKFQIPKKTTILFSIGLLLAFVTGYLSYGVALTHAEDLTLIAVPAKYKDIDINRLWEVLDRSEEKFVGSVDHKKVLDGILAGAVASLEDPYTVYINTDGLEKFNEELNGKFEGIGAEISTKDGKLIVTSPLPESPAEKAGIKPGDSITKIDGTSIAGLTMDEAIAKIRGKQGTIVTLTIEREGIAGSQDIKVTRDTINVKSVKLTMKPNGIAHIKLLRFDGSTAQLLDQALQDGAKQGMKGIVLDVRNNPGGYLDAAVAVASEFISDGEVVEEEYKGGHRDVLSVTRSGRAFTYPLVVLMNGGSASASEIISGALQDHGRARLIGEKSYGKGSVQEVVPLSYGGAVKVTIAKWFTPKNHAIDKHGLDPDIVVKSVEGKDVQLDRAIKELQNMIKN